MFSLIVRRCIRAILVTLIITFIIFFLIRVIPGDPASLIAPQATEEVKQELRRELGLTKPIIIQYVLFMSNIIKGDFGKSIYYKESVVSIISQVFPYTAVLLVFSLLISLFVSVPLGVLSSIRPGGIIDRISFFMSVVFVSIPNFWLGLIFVLVISMRYKLLPGFGYGGWEYFILPTITLAVTIIPAQLRTIRVCMEDAMGQEFVTFAKARGIPNKIIIWKRTLINAIMPLIAVLGVQVGVLLGTVIMVEYVFTFPGLGLTTLYAVQRRDYQLIQGLVVVFSLICTFVGTGVDILQLLIDPRLRKQTRV